MCVCICIYVRARVFHGKAIQFPWSQAKAGLTPMAAAAAAATAAAPAG